MNKVAIPQGLPASLTGGAPRHRYPSDATRAERRRRSRRLPAHEVFAGKVLKLTERAPDQQSRDELHHVVHNLRLRFRPQAAMRRFAAETPLPPVSADEAGGFARFGSDEQKRAAGFAQELLFLMDSAPDGTADRELNAVAKGILLRFTPDEHKRRIAVLRALETAELLSLDEIVSISRVNEKCVQAILDDFAGAETGLAAEWEPDGKRRCGRGGTTRYFRLTRLTSTKRRFSVRSGK